MKIKYSLLLCLTFLIFAGNASAQSTEFDTFWKQFKSAVIDKHDAVVSNLVGYPLSMPYGVKTIQTKAELVRRYNEIFNSETDAAKCFTSKPPQKVSAGRYEISCGFKKDKTGDAGEPFVYAFELTKTGWKFISFDNVNE